ncbi:uncharacterized protein N7484_003439 [Penicillium longicatenatum]|uniref:uncharacterized protein n=1 Tax=Penicillium longicatenatum TaxID=1561947 RepID=UPI002547DA93|nr:uncharacterized protein N7484_003439 [Penicillium longicatenatum]KAJ5649716.1 hypothetical protein N7484_003439 [Penicillium longicatenatum]
MTFAIEPCFPADAPGLATAMMSARLTDPHWVKQWEDNVLPNDIITKAIDRVPWNLISGRETKRHQKVIDVRSGEIVGYGRWLLPPHLARNDVWQEAQVAEVTSDERAVFEKLAQAYTKNGRPIGLKSGAEMNYRSAPLEAADERVTRDGPFLTLDYLTTTPSYWRRGVGTMLVESGLQIADQYKLKTYVMSEPAALKLYLNLGFKLVETVSTDYSQYGGLEPMVHHFLVREPSI